MNRSVGLRTKLGWLAAIVAVVVAALLLAPAAQGPAKPAAPSLEPTLFPPELVSPFDRKSPVIDRKALPAESTAAAPPTQARRPASTSLPSLSFKELQALKERLAEGPDPDGEFARMAAFMIFGDAVQRLRQLHDEGGDRVEMQALARLIDDSLSQRLSRQEVGASDALHLKALVLGVLEPDPVRRQSALATWQEQQANNAAASAPASVPRRAW